LEKQRRHIDHQEGKVGGIGAGSGRDTDEVFQPPEMLRNCLASRKTDELVGSFMQVSLAQYASVDEATAGKQEMLGLLAVIGGDPDYDPANPEDIEPDEIVTLDDGRTLWLYETDILMLVIVDFGEDSGNYVGFVYTVFIFHPRR
jgi:hypothetical protein